MTPSKPGDPSQGKPAADEQTELEATEAKQAAATEAAAESPEGEPEAQRKPRRRTRATKAEGTAAEVTGEQKDAAEAAVHEGSAEPVDDADSDAGSGDDGDAAPPEQAPPPSRRRRRGADADRQSPAPAPTRRGERPAGERVLVRATARYVRTSPRKARVVCDHIRGKSIQEARAILAHTPRAVARDWSKLLESAIANAEHNHELIGDDLRVFAVTADDGPTLKRFQPRAMGRATRIRKRTSHLTIMLTPKE